MVHGVAAVWVPVDDMQRAVAFYRDVLGLKVNDTQDEWSDLEANGLKIGLNGRDRESTSGSGGAVITFEPEGSIDETVAGLQDKGVEFAGGISDHPWGRIAPFKDSEGNDLQLYEKPS